MSKKPEILFYLEDGTPVVAAEAPKNIPQDMPPQPTVALQKIYGPADAPRTSNGYAPLGPPVDKKGNPKRETKAQKAARESKNQIAAQLAINAGDLNIEMDLSKLNPSVKPQKTKEQKRKEWIGDDHLNDWWQDPLGEKKQGGRYGLDIDPAHAANLDLQLAYAKQHMELLYPGAAARSHSPGGRNLGEPETAAFGGRAGAQGTNRWEYRSGAAFPGDGISIVQVLQQYDIYG